MEKWWSALFGVVMAAAAGLFVVAPFVGWWLPEGVSTHAGDIDLLFYVILAITGFFFILTEALLVVFMFRFAARPGETQHHVFGHHAMEEKVYWTSFFKRLFRPVSAVLHNQHRVELAWTLVPSVILLYIAFAQVNTWAEVKYLSRMPTAEADDKVPVQVEVSARQFEWRMRYPSPERWQSWKSTPKLANDFARNPHQDDVHVVNELHVFTNPNPQDRSDHKQFPAALVQLKTTDIIHSFNIPVMRVKQDSLPGKTLQVWFRPTKSNTVYNKARKSWEDGGGHNDAGHALHDTLVWEIACAELCGWGHYRMIGRLYVHPSEEDWLNWLRAAEAKGHGTTRETTAR